MKQKMLFKVTPLLAGSIGLLLLCSAWFFSGHSAGGIKQKKIAVIMCSTLPFHEKVLEGIEKAAQTSKYTKYMAVKPYIFNQIDAMQIALMIDAAIDWQPDLIIPVGITTTRSLNEIMRKRGLTTPVVYVGLHNGKELGFIESDERPGGFMTGVMSEGFDSLVPAKLLLAAKPDMKKVFLPYDTTGSTLALDEEAARVAKDYLESRGVAVDVITMDGCNDVLYKFSLLLTDHDTFMGQETGAITQFNAGIAKLCSQRGITFFCSTLDGVNVGAAITYATVPVHMGVAGLEQATRILFEGKNPATLPIVSLTNRREVYINLAAAGLQNYKPDIEQLQRKIAQDEDLKILENKIHVVASGK